MKKQRTGTPRPFITATDDAAAHVNACGNTFPIIVLSPVDAEFSEVFFDATNMPINLGLASEIVERFTAAYTEFFMVPAWVGASTSVDVKYLNQFVVRTEHGPMIATQLFELLNSLRGG